MVIDESGYDASLALDIQNAIADNFYLFAVDHAASTGGYFRRSEEDSGNPVSPFGAPAAVLSP